MSDGFKFSADGEVTGLFGPVDIVVGDSASFGGGTLSVELEGGDSRHALSDTLTAGGVIKVNTSASFALVLAGATSPDVSGVIYPAKAVTE